MPASATSGGRRVMVRIVECVTQEHVPWLVAVAAVVCVLSSITTFGLLDRYRAASEARRLLWLLAPAFAVGAGIWSTHFIAMLAYDPGVVVGYEATRTLLSLLAAISVGLLSFLVLVGQGRFRVPMAGAMLAGGIAFMHYLGMAGGGISGR